MSAFFTVPQASADMSWYPDIGSTNHLTNDIQNLNLHAETYNGVDQIQVGDEAGLVIAHIGSSEIKSSQSGFTLHNILHVPQTKKNLIYVSQFTKDNNVFIKFHSSHFFVKDEVTKKVLLQGTPKDGLYPFPSSISTSSPSQSFLCQRVSLEVWHRRLGHPTYQTVKHLVSKFSLPVSSNKIPGVCSAKGKSHRLPFPVSQSISYHLLDLIFSDVWGPSPILSTKGNKYYVSFVNHFSKFVWLYPLANKSDVLTIFTQFNRQIKCVQTDCGDEFQTLNRYFHQVGIQHRISCPYTSQQNGYVERKHRHVVEMGLSLLSQSYTPHCFWDDAF